jgi:HPt (histidine-containing phosphotransfer) domain-containing protein
MVLDEDIVAQFLEMGGKEMLEEMWEEFREQTEEMLIDSKSHLEAGNFEEIMATLHTIKGTASTLGLKGLSEAAEKGELNIRNGNTAHTSADVAEVEEAFKIFSHQYKDYLQSL